MVLPIGSDGVAPQRAAPPRRLIWSGVRARVIDAYKNTCIKRRLKKPKLSIWPFTAIMIFGALILPFGVVTCHKLFWRFISVTGLFS